MRISIDRSTNYHTLAGMVCTFLVVIVTGCRPVYALDESPRYELLRVLELQTSVAEQLGNTTLVERLQRAVEDLNSAEVGELPPNIDTVDDLRLLGDRLEDMDNKLRMGILSEQVNPSIRTENLWASPSLENPHGISLTPAPYFDGGIIGAHCFLPDAGTGNRFDTELALDLQLVLSVAKVAWAGTEVACGLDVVALGTAGIGAAFCIAAAVAVGAAEETVDAFQRCDATVDEAHLDGAFLRAEDNFKLNGLIYSNMMTQDTEMKAKLTEVTNNQEVILENQELIIKLLKSPQGSRPGWGTQGF